jgi:PKD repeat protein
VKFFDTATGVTLSRWTWSFGDGNWFNTTSSAQRSPAYVYQIPGIYTAQLTVCNISGCNTTSPA